MNTRRLINFFVIFYVTINRILKLLEDLVVNNWNRDLNYVITYSCLIIFQIIMFYLIDRKL